MSKIKEALQITIDLYCSITSFSKQMAVYDNIVFELQSHLKSILLSAGVTPQHELQGMFSNEAGYAPGKFSDFLDKEDLGIVENDVQKELDAKERAEGGAQGFNRQSKHISLLASNAKTIFHSMIYHAVREAKHKNTK